MTQTIVQFLLERLGEEATLAQRVADRYTTRGPFADQSRRGAPYWPLPSAAANFRNHSDPEIRAGLDLIELYSPARVLADIAAKRRIVEDCTRILGVDGWEYSDAPDLAEATLRHMAAPYADHPDFQEEWKP